MQTQAELVLKSLVDSYTLIKSLSERINQLENRTETAARLPWEETEKKADVSYNKTPTPTPAIENLATGMIRQMVAYTYNDSKRACKAIFNAHEKVVIWKSGVVTTLGESIDTKNPLAVFKSRACAKLRLRKAGFNVPEAKESGGYTSNKYIIASR